MDIERAHVRDYNIRNHSQKKERVKNVTEDIDYHNCSTDCTVYGILSVCGYTEY